MSGRQASIAWGCVLSALVLFCVTMSTGLTQAQKQSRDNQAATARSAAGSDVEKLLPAGAIAYLGWDGSAVHEDAWQATAAYQSLYETGLADVMRKLLVFILQQSGTNPNDVMPLVDQISQQGVSLAVSLPAAGPPLPQAVVVVHEGQELLPTVDRFIRRAVAGDIKIDELKIGSRTVSRVLIPNSPGVEFGWWKEGSHLVLAGGIDVVNATIAVADGKAANITKNPLWASSHDVQKNQVVSLVSWLDFAALRKAYGDLPVPNPNRAAPPLTVNGILDTLGLSQLGPLVYRSGYAGPALWSETTLDAPEPRTGVLAPWSYGSVAMDDLPPMPENVSGFYARSLDWSRMYDETLKLLRNAAQLGPPQAAAQLEEAIAEVNASLEIDLEQDLFEPLGDVACLFADQTQGIMGFGAVLAFKVDDAARLRTTLSQLMLQLATESRGQVIVRVVPKYDREITILQFAELPFAPAVCVDDEWMVVSLTTQALETFLLRVDGKLPKWEPGQEHAEGLKQFEGEFTAISIADPRETVRSLLGLAPMILGVAQMGMVQQGGPRLPFNAEDIPPSELITAPLFPNVSVCTADESGIRWQSRTSIPSFPLTTSFGGGSGVAVTGTLVALLLPAVQQARVAARRTQSKNNLKQLGLAMHNFHDVFNHFPPGTHPNDALEVEKRFSWLAEILPFIDQAPLFNQLDMDRAWDDEANEPLTRRQLPVFMNPNDPNDSGQAITNYVGLAGVGEDAPLLPADHKRAGVFGYNRTIGLRDITDGTSNTIAVSESSDASNRWAAGGKPTIRALTQKPYINGPDGLGGSFRGGCNVLLCDGSVRFLSENIDPTLMEQLTTIAGGEVVGGF